MDLQHIKGIGKKTLEILYQNQIYSIEDLLQFYPYRYLVLQPEALVDSEDKITITIPATVIEIPKVSYIRKNFNSLRFRAEAYGKIINVTIFNRAFLKPHLPIGKEITLIGKYNSKTNMFTANDLKLFKINHIEIIPIYHLIKGIHSKTLQSLITRALEELDTFPKLLPESVEKKHAFLSKKETLKELHFPSTLEKIELARKRIIYEELFLFMVKIEYLKQLNDQEQGIEKKIDVNKTKNFLQQLPFSLTKDQEKAIHEGLQDLLTSKRMNRLLLGDVGSGKTIVATTIIYANFLAGYQSAFLAPTEILAMQHFDSIRTLLKNTNMQIEILIGSMTKKEKTNIAKRLQNGEIDLLIGTHAILNENLFFQNLGFIVTDEQHRFGVNQREILKNKGILPDMMFLSATPIPRTYALTIYGDMDTSLIKEKPLGRKDIITKVVKEANLKEVLLKTLEEIKAGHQVYVVAPMILEQEMSDLKTVSLLKEKFDLAYHGKIPIGMLHGKMKKNEKDTVMNDFKTGKTKILISTTVIEVGVDVSNATIMIIFNSERFGLATLHQLRGRVGRGNLQSYCYLICNEEKERLKVLEESNDGFYISEKDFTFRGEGDLFGVKQSGDMTFQMANLKRDYDILLEMKKEAKDFVDKKLYMKNDYYKKIIEKIDFTN